MHYIRQYTLKVYKDNRHYPISENKFNLETTSGSYEIDSLFIKGAIEDEWYDHEDDMTEVSTLNPQWFFLLYGTGEDEDGVWVKLFYRGECYEGRVETTFPPITLSDGTIITPKYPH